MVLLTCQSKYKPVRRTGSVRREEEAVGEAEASPGKRAPVRAKASPSASNDHGDRVLQTPRPLMLLLRLHQVGWRGLGDV